jgi:hypothetical protein
MINSNILLELIPPAIIISFAVFLIKFFGRALSDQAPFADDRKWKEELEGTTFFLFYVLSPLSGALLLIGRGFNPLNMNHYDILFIILGVVSIFIAKSIKKDVFNFFAKAEVVRKDSHINIKQGINTISLFIFLLIIYYYNNQAYFYIIPTSIFLFINLIYLAIFLSIKKENILIGDIFFLNKKKSIKNCRIIKVNNDNIRLLKDNKIIIINKGLIERMEIKCNKKDE